MEHSKSITADKAVARTAAPASSGNPGWAGAMHTDLDRPSVSKFTLILSPAALEEQFWSSVTVLKPLDMLGLFISILLNVMLLFKFGFGRGKQGMMWHFAPVLLYLTTGLAQMAVLLLRGGVHQKHRFAITLANRILKALTVTWAAVNMSDRAVMQQFTGTLNSVAIGGIAGVHSTAAYMKVLRTVVSLPLLWLSHAVNFMLPFWLMLPLQLYTLLAVSKVIPVIVCVLLGQPPHIFQPAAVMAAHVGWIVRALIALALPLPQRPWEVGVGGGRGAGGSLDSATAQELLLLVTVTFTMILVVIPCAVAYHVELSWKSDFLQRQRGSQQEPLGDPPVHTRPWLMSPAWVTFDIVCLVLLVSETIVYAAPPLHCECQA